MPEGKTVRIEIGVWYDEERGDIHIAQPGGFITTINDQPGSVRAHPHLFAHLARVLRDAGVSAPPLVPS